MLFYILFYFVSFLLNCLKCLIQILDDIVDVLGTDGKTDGVWFDSLIQQFFLGALAVRGGCRMDYQRFYIGNVSQQGEQFQIVDEIFCFLCIAFDFEPLSGGRRSSRAGCSGSVLRHRAALPGNRLYFRGNMEQIPAECLQ